MRLVTRLVTVLVITVGCQTSAPVSHDLSESDLAAVRAVWDAVDAANLASDWDAAERHLTRDFVHLDPRTQPIRGAQAWREWVESMELGDADGAFVVDEVSGSGDVAYVMWTFDMSWTEGGESVQSRGKGMSLFRRGGDGTWLMSRNAWNMDP